MEVSHRPIAPWWHTALMVALMLAGAPSGHRRASMARLASRHFRLYVLTILWECVLAALVLWGIRLRKTPLRKLLGVRRRGVRAWFADLGIALGFWFLCTLGYEITSIAMWRLHIAASTRVLSQMSPGNGAELALWIALSLSSGVCEEFIFRGYFQQQFAAVNGRLWVGVVGSAALFGAVHAYQGIGGVIAITAMGAIMSALVIKRGGLRASMMAHAWNDIFSGVVLFLLKHSHRI